MREHLSTSSFSMKYPIIKTAVDVSRETSTAVFDSSGNFCCLLFLYEFFCQLHRCHAIFGVGVGSGAVGVVLGKAGTAYHDLGF